MSDWADLGLTRFLAKPRKSFVEYNASDFDLFVDDISGNKIKEGIAQNKVFSLNFDDGTIERKEGDITRLSIGKFNDGKFGLRVYDSSGDLSIDQTV